MSLIHSAELNGVEPFESLIELLKHSEEVRQEPARLMPWSYPAPVTSLTFMLVVALVLPRLLCIFFHVDAHQ
jgi:hypothetical protein